MIKGWIKLAKVTVITGFLIHMGLKLKNPELAKKKTVQKSGFIFLRLCAETKGSIQVIKKTKSIMKHKFT